MESQLEEKDSGEALVKELETKYKDLQSEAQTSQETLQEMKVKLKQEVQKVKEEKRIRKELKKEMTRVTEEVTTRKEEIKELQTNLDSERERAGKHREELGECLRKATEESNGDEKGRNCNSPCMISKIAGNDLIEMSQKKEKSDVEDPSLESQGDVDRIDETTDTTPTSELFF